MPALYKICHVLCPKEGKNISTRFCEDCEFWEDADDLCIYCSYPKKKEEKP